MALTFLIGFLSGCAYSGHVNPNEKLEGKFNEKSAALAIATEPNGTRDEDFERSLLERRKQYFDAGYFQCIKFDPGWLTYGYAQVACDFGNDEIEVFSF